MTSAFFTDFKAWIAKPFSPDMSAYHWALFMGLILIIAVFWRMVIRALVNEA